MKSISETVTNKAGTFKRLSTLERKQRREKELYFNGDEKFAPIHECKAKLFRLTIECDRTYRDGGSTILL